MKKNGNAALRIGALVLIGFGASAETCQSPAGVKVYLSPAYHNHQNIGCAGYDEEVGARAIAERARDVLVSRGYTVRVGTGSYQTNFNDSNAWGAHVHVPVHSNAGAWGCDPGDPASRGGTWTMYNTAGSRGHNLADFMLGAIRDYSPGTNDQLLQRTDLLELKTNARSAYAEMAFHTYYWDVVWMAFDTATAGEVLANGISRHCAVNDCKNGQKALAPSYWPELDAEDFDEAVGGALPEVRDALDARLAAASPLLEGAVLAVEETGGVLLVDLADIRDLGSGHLFHASGVVARAFELTEADAVVFRIDGSAGAFCEWTESDCRALTREETFEMAEANGW